MNRLIFSGAGHTGTAALKSVQAFFDCVEICHSSENVIFGKRDCDKIISDFSDSDCEIVLIAAYAPFINKEQLAHKTYINIHGALLPRWRGYQPVFWAMMNGDKQIGVSIHLVDEFMDSGDILAQYAFDYNDETVDVVRNQIDDLILKNTGTVISQYLNGDLKPKPQNHELATYGAKRNLNDCIINLEWDCDTVARFFIALSKPLPPPRVVIHGKTYEITRHKLIKNEYFGPLGRVCNIDREGLWIRIKDGFLVISELKQTGNGVVMYAANMSDIVKTGCRLINPTGGGGH